MWFYVEKIQALAVFTNGGLGDLKKLQPFTFVSWLLNVSAACKVYVMNRPS